jgi:hypothetical protein
VNKAELDARADAVLASLAEAREGGGGTRALIRDAGGRLAEQVRVQFPGLDGDLARVLASAMEFLGDFERGVLAVGEQWEGRTAPLVLLILGFAASELRENGAER